MTPAEWAQIPAHLPKAGSDFLLGLSRGEYVREVQQVQKVLSLIGRFWPPALLISRGLTIFLTINRLSAPMEVVPDGRGGYVPSTNSRYDPKTGRFLD